MSTLHSIIVLDGEARCAGAADAHLSAAAVILYRNSAKVMRVCCAVKASPFNSMIGQTKFTCDPNCRHLRHICMVGGMHGPWDRSTRRVDVVNGGSSVARWVSAPVVQSVV